MTLQDRADAYAAKFPQFLESHLRVAREQNRDVLYGIWLLGNDYRSRTTLYGSYPPSYLSRILALFPDVAEGDTLHAFSGSLPAGNYARCDLAHPAEYPCSVYDLPDRRHGNWTWRMVVADPPYSAADAKRYGTPPLDRRRALSALAIVCSVSGFLVWLDGVWPMHRKAEWLTVGRIAVIRSTNHRVRLCSIFERVDG